MGIGSFSLLKILISSHYKSNDVDLIDRQYITSNYH